MKALERLESHLKTRLTDLSKAKEQGRKIIGYSAGGYLPEELVLACGAIPLCFIQAGDNAILRDAGSYICRWLDPFWRSQIGYLTSRKDPYYTIADLIVIPITDNHVRGFSNTAGYYTPEIESFVFGVPHVKDGYALEYYLQGITRLKKKLEDWGLLNPIFIETTVVEDSLCRGFSLDEKLEKIESGEWEGEMHKGFSRRGSQGPHDGSDMGRKGGFGFRL